MLNDPVQALVPGRAEGEDQPRRNAARAEERTQIIPHAANFGLATAAGLVVGLWGETGAGIRFTWYPPAPRVGINAVIVCRATRRFNEQGANKSRRL